MTDRDGLVLCLAKAASPETADRCRELGGFLSRLLTFEGQHTELITSCRDGAAALLGLADIGALTVGADPQTGQVGAYYLPTWQGREKLGQNAEDKWPSAVLARHRKVIRSTPGAIFYFPIENSAGADSAAIEVFITDWSPCPGACAIAIHPSHPLSPGLSPGETARFAGTYCRHPLTGDLLPIWVAEWVKPTFGTGAVLVNPAHDSVDLAFGRKVGLPIRFALAERGYDGSPATWPKPPVIKSGITVRTGPTDGLEYQEAQNVYFATLAERGLARSQVDHGTSTFLVADLRADGPAELGLDRARRTVGRLGDLNTEPARWDPSPVLEVVAAVDRAGSLEVVTPSPNLESDVLALRLLLSEPRLDLEGVGVTNVTTVAAVAGQTSLEGLARRLVLLVGADPKETLAVKAPVVDSANRFLEAHEKILKTPSDGEDQTPEITRAASQIKTLLQRRDLKQAFTHLYRLQKILAKCPSPSQSDRAEYETLALVLAGLEGGTDNSLLLDAWQRL